jgi:hypothetical protein
MAGAKLESRLAGGKQRQAKLLTNVVVLHELLQLAVVLDHSRHVRVPLPAIATRRQDVSGANTL